MYQKMSKTFQLNYSTAHARASRNLHMHQNIPSSHRRKIEKNADLSALK